ncbi:MAG: C25 family cysteine peptidase [Anaerolineae bacterium]
MLFLVMAGTFACRNTETAPPLVGDLANDAIKINVREDGVYRITLQALQQAGLQLESLSLDHVRLSQAGRQVPFFIEENALIFYGQASDSMYTRDRTYILRMGEPGKPMDTQPVPGADGPFLEQVRQAIHLEDNAIYLAETRNAGVEDVWFWQSLGQQQKLDLPLALPTGSIGPATLRIHLWGATHNPTVLNDHDFDLLVNGRLLETIRWEGETAFTSNTQAPPGLLTSGENTITLDNSFPGASFLDIMQLDWVEVDLATTPTAENDQLVFTSDQGTVALSGFSGRPLLLDISNADAPRRLTEWRYENGQAVAGITENALITAVGPAGFRSPEGMERMRVSHWSEPENGADLIIITTDELAPGLSRLVEAREAEGLRVSLVPAAEIYDEFGEGAASPESIQTFIAYAFRNWSQPPPQYVLLVGDATTDYRNYLGGAPANQIPSLIVPVAFGGETVSDSRLADVDGDLRPDLAIGRWPVSSLDDVKSLVERTLAYEQGTAVDRAIFAADGTEAQFAEIANRLRAKSDLTKEQAEVLSGPQADEVAAQWNKGAWLTTYIGHGSVEQWGKDDVFNLDAVSQLQSQTPPIVLQLTCLTGLFAHPELTSISESMIRHQKGPVLLIAATSLTLSAHQEPFAGALFQALLAPQNKRIGDAFQQAKRSLDIENNNGLREISDTYALLGDPSATIVRP